MSRAVVCANPFSAMQRFAPASSSSRFPIPAPYRISCTSVLDDRPRRTSLTSVPSALVTSAQPRAGRREWMGLAVLTLPALLASMDLSVLFMAAPWLAADLTPTGPELLWIMDVYGFLMAGLLLTMGALGDRIGRRRLLLTGA